MCPRVAQDVTQITPAPSYLLATAKCGEELRDLLLSLRLARDHLFLIGENPTASALVEAHRELTRLPRRSRTVPKYVVPEEPRRQKPTEMPQLPRSNHRPLLSLSTTASSYDRPRVSPRIDQLYR